MIHWCKVQSYALKGDMVILSILFLKFWNYHNRAKMRVYMSKSYAYNHDLNDILYKS